MLRIEIKNGHLTESTFCGELLFRDNTLFALESNGDTTTTPLTAAQAKQLMDGGEVAGWDAVHSPELAATVQRAIDDARGEWLRASRRKRRLGRRQGSPKKAKASRGGGRRTAKKGAKRKAK